MNRQLELINKLGLDEKSRSNLLISIPNEFFELLINLQKSKRIKSNHIGLVWSYIYLNTLMYRHSTYNEFPITISEMKELLGYAPNNQTIDYIFKRNGLLEEVGLFESTRNYPVNSQFNFDNEELEIDHIDDFGEEFRNSYFKSKGITKRMFCKKPLFAFNRDGYEYGTFYSFENTTVLEFEVFKYFITNSELSVNDFYVYSILKRGQDTFVEYTIGFKNLVSISGIPRSTLALIINNLRKFNTIESISNMSNDNTFYVGGVDYKKLKPNTIIVNDYSKFSISNLSLDMRKVEFINDLNTVNLPTIEMEFFDDELLNSITI